MRSSSLVSPSAMACAAYKNKSPHITCKAVQLNELVESLHNGHLRDRGKWPL